MNEPNELIPAYLQATKVNVGFCMYAIPASDSQNGRRNKTMPLESTSDYEEKEHIRSSVNNLYQDFDPLRKYILDP